MQRHMRILAILFTITLASCKSTTDDQNTTDSNPPGTPPDIYDELGVNIKKLAIEDFYSPKPRPGYFYGRLVIETKLSVDQLTAQESFGLLQYVRKMISKDTNQFALTIKPTVGSTELPRIPLFSFAYDSSNNSWSTKGTQVYYSPLVKITNDTSFKYSLEYLSSDDTSIFISDTIKNLADISSLFEPSSWIVSTMSEPLLNSSVNKLETAINNQFKSSKSAKTNGILAIGFKGEKSQTLFITDSNDELLAEVTLTVLLANRVLGGLVEDDMISSDPNIYPQMDKHENPLNQIRVNGQDLKTLSKELEDAISLLVDEDNPAQFARQCQLILNDLQRKYGLNTFDSINAMRFVLRPTRFTRFKELYESGCLSSSDFELLEDLKVPLEAEFKPRTAAFNKEQLELMGNFSRLPSYFAQDMETLQKSFKKHLFYSLNNNDIENNPIPSNILQGNSIGLVQGSMYLNEFIFTLSQFNTARYGLYSGQDRFGNETDPNVASFVARVRGTCSMTKVLMWSDPETGKYDKVTIEPARQIEYPVSKWNDILEPLSKHPDKFPKFLRDKDDVVCAQASTPPPSDLVLLSLSTQQ
jgi:hypothetical protein